MPKLILSGRMGCEILDLHPKLNKILKDILSIWPAEDCVVTSIWRSADENKAAKAKSKIHVVGPPYRAVDLRITNLGAAYQTEAEEIADTINMIWAYDPDRPNYKVVYAKVHGTGPHMHCQVHPNTTRVT